jgi:hypothetical protein
VQHSKISRYRSEDSSLSDKEWESCLTSLLLGTGPVGHLDVTVKFTDQDLAIQIGNRVSGATVGRYLPLGPSASSMPLVATTPYPRGQTKTHASLLPRILPAPLS